jgi:hypothetical protein
MLGPLSIRFYICRYIQRFRTGDGELLDIGVDAIIMQTGDDAEI